MPIETNSPGQQPALAEQPSRRRTLLCGGTILVATLGAGLLLDRKRAPKHLLGRPAPALDLPQLDGMAQLVAPASLRGRVWMLNVWASWCAPCRDEHPLLLALAQEVNVPLIGLGTRDDPRDAQEWLRRWGNPYRATLVDRDGRAAADYGVDGLPTTFVIDGQGLVQHQHTGALTRAVWTQELLPRVRRLARAEAP